MENNKNYFWAMGLIALVIIIQWYFFTPKQPAPTPKAPATQQQTNPAAPGTQGTTTTTDASKPTSTNPFDVQTETKPQEEKKETVPPKDAVNENLVAETVRDVVVDTDLFIATFTNEGAGLKSFVLKNYYADQLNEKEPAPLMDLISDKAQISNLYPFYFPDFDKAKKDPLAELNKKNFVYTGLPEVVLSGSEKQNASITFKYADVESNTSVYKTFTFTNNSYVIGLDYHVVINGKDRPDASVVFGPDIEKKDGFKRAMHEGLQFGYNTIDGDYEAETVITQDFQRVTATLLNKQVDPLFRTAEEIFQRLNVFFEGCEDQTLISFKTQTDQRVFGLIENTLILFWFRNRTQRTIQ